jgi:hypothetical protein
MCVLNEVYSANSLSVKAGRVPVPLPVAGDGGVCGSATLATLDTLSQFLSHLALTNPYDSFTDISLSLASCTREES